MRIGRACKNKIYTNTLQAQVNIAMKLKVAYSEEREREKNHTAQENVAANAKCMGFAFFV